MLRMEIALFLVVVFLAYAYFSPEEKKAVENCIPVFKAIMRKFRQSISFTFMQLYTDSGMPCAAPPSRLRGYALPLCCRFSM